MSSNLSKKYKNVKAAKSKIKRSDLNPVFHFQDKSEDSKVLTKSFVRNALKTGVVNLAGKGLRTIPSEIWNLEELVKRRSSIFVPEFDKCPDDDNDDDQWWARKSITNLNLSSNVIQEISSEIQQLLDLTILNLSKNSLVTAPKEIRYLTKLVNINLSHNKITSLPSEFFEFPNLKSLNLCHNYLEELDPSVSDLNMLEFIDVSHNKLNGLPNGIGFMVRLKELTASNNSLQYIPDDLTMLRNLQKLNISCNAVSTLPALENLKKLQYFYGQQNNFTEVPDFVGCEKLDEVHLSNNSIMEISKNFCEALPQLKLLDLKHNKIENLPDEIQLLSSLVQLELVNNNISSIPTNLSTLKSLNIFTISGNPIRNIRSDILNGGSKRILRCLIDRHKEKQNEKSDNSITESQNILPDKFKMRKTQCLNVASMDLKELPQEAIQDAIEAKVHAADLSKNNFNVFPDELQSLSAQLDQINISQNKLNCIPKVIESFENLLYLNLSMNCLDALPDELCGLKNLRELDLSYNNFLKIPGCIYSLSRVEILNLRNNKLIEIDVNENTLKQLKKLATLDLANNDIHFVSPELGTMKQINSLDLLGNPFRYPRQAILEKGTQSIMSYLRDRLPVVLNE